MPFSLLPHDFAADKFESGNLKCKGHFVDLINVTSKCRTWTSESKEHLHVYVVYGEFAYNHSTVDEEACTEAKRDLSPKMTGKADDGICQMPTEQGDRQERFERSSWS